ncbi:MAG TPA: hypothetical protein DEQ38_13450, partial [Elusimicrobia bacterium]|nr:hypothetical protein [Elusimicrobiota bacterium]
MKTMTAGRKAIHISENQAKVIKDKYLRDENSPEQLFERVAHNIALSEIIFSPNARKWGVFEGVNCRVVETATDGTLSPTLLFHEGLAESSEREANFLRLLSNLEKAYHEFSDAREAADRRQTEFYNLMAGFDFLPNSPTLMNA